ncbi:hypothetical protein FYK55_17185 [Roseiconus nitratireducens]|uniref:Uncharacterized protein n=1 Tax=Roseiconus nitratireducens TaxID=2605748 RepID=A0A5M6D7U1_9BACT|nr:hypothetical protein [Roseiconus nitratireducens]KAA5541929.1 hypothetical protein FYK55_17185 [Roseiconus nitratireducens]
MDWENLRVVACRINLGREAGGDVASASAALAEVLSNDPSLKVDPVRGESKLEAAPGEVFWHQCWTPCRGLPVGFELLVPFSIEGAVKGLETLRKFNDVFDARLTVGFESAATVTINFQRGTPVHHRDSKLLAALNVPLRDGGADLFDASASCALHVLQRLGLAGRMHLSLDSGKHVFEPTMCKLEDGELHGNGNDWRLLIAARKIVNFGTAESTWNVMRQCAANHLGAASYIRLRYSCPEDEVHECVAYLAKTHRVWRLRADVIASEQYSPFADPGCAARLPAWTASIAPKGFAPVPVVGASAEYRKGEASLLVHTDRGLEWLNDILETSGLSSNAQLLEQDEIYPEL